MLKASQHQMNRAALSAESTNSTPPFCIGLLATMPTGLAVEAAEADDQLLGEQRLDLEERAVVDEAVDHLVHVVAALLGRDRSA